MGENRTPEGRCTSRSSRFCRRCIDTASLATLPMEKRFVIAYGSAKVTLRVFLPCSPIEFIESLWYTLDLRKALPFEAFRDCVTLSDEHGDRIIPIPHAIPDGFTVVVGISSDDVPSAPAKAHAGAMSSGTKRVRGQSSPEERPSDGMVSPAAAHSSGVAPGHRVSGKLSLRPSEAADITTDAPVYHSLAAAAVLKPILRGTIAPASSGLRKYLWAGNWAMSGEDLVKSDFRYSFDLPEQHIEQQLSGDSASASHLLPSNEAQHVRCCSITTFWGHTTFFLLVMLHSKWSSR